MTQSVTQISTTAENPSRIEDFALLRLPQVLKLIPVSRSSWLAGVASGIYPAPKKLGARAVAWTSQSIRDLAASL